MYSALIVEGNALARLALLRILGRHGWWVDAAENIERALELLERLPPTVVLIDRDIENGSGLSLLIAIRIHPRWHAVPVALTCGSSTLLDVAEAFESGANDFLRQPFLPNDIVDRMSALALHPDAVVGSRVRVFDVQRNVTIEPKQTNRRSPSVDNPGSL